MKGVLAAPTSILLAALLIAAAITVSNRWEIITNRDGLVLRLDRWTGAIWACAVDSDSFERAMMTKSAWTYRCSPPSPDEIKAVKPPMP